MYTSGMMFALRQLESTSSVSEKQTILSNMDKQIPTFKDMLVYALDPYKRYGIKKFPAAATNLEKVSKWADIRQFLEDILRGKTTGSGRIVECANLASRLPPDGRELFKRVLLKDLRCGVGATLVNKVFPGLIPEFGVMLATPLEEKHIKKLRAAGVIYIQPKMNGDRSVTICQHGEETEQLTRNGHPQLNYQNIGAALRRVCAQALNSNERNKIQLPAVLVPKREADAPWPMLDLVFDGEVIVGDFFKTRSTKRLAGNEAEGTKFYCFDVILASEWKSGATTNFSDRLALLRVLKQNFPDCIEYVPTYRLTGDQITWKRLCNLRDQMKKLGFEGLIVRLDEAYNFKTRSSLYKLKEMDSVDCLIVEVLPGEEGKKHAHHAGAVLVELPWGGVCKAGLKLSDAERDEMWKDRATVAGKVAEIAYQDKTTNEQNEPKLQFPVFVRVREDKS